MAPNVKELLENYEICCNYLLNGLNIWDFGVTYEIGVQCDIFSIDYLLLSEWRPTWTRIFIYLFFFLIVKIGEAIKWASGALNFLVIVAILGLICQVAPNVI